VNLDRSLGQHRRRRGAAIERDLQDVEAPVGCSIGVSVTMAPSGACKTPASSTVKPSAIREWVIPGRLERLSVIKSSPARFVENAPGGANPMPKIFEITRLSGLDFDLFLSSRATGRHWLIHRPRT